MGCCVRALGAAPAPEDRLEGRGKKLNRTQIVGAAVCGAAAITIAGCTSGHRTSSQSPPTPSSGGATTAASSPVSSSSSSTAATATPEPTDASTPPSIPPPSNSSLGTSSQPSGSARPAPSITGVGNVLVLDVSGGGRSSAGLTGISCSATTVTAKVTGGGRIALDTASGVLQVSDVPPVGDVRLTGSATRQGTSVHFGGSATGTTGSVQVKC